MMVVMLVAGIGCLLAGLLAIGLGIPVKEFSFGNTLILAGAVAACTGLVMLGLWVVVRELQNIARRLGPGCPGAEPRLPTAAAPRHWRRKVAAPRSSRDQSPRKATDDAAAPWQDPAARERARSDVPSPEPSRPHRRQTEAQSDVFLHIAEGT